MKLSSRIVFDLGIFFHLLGNWAFDLGDRLIRASLRPTAYASMRPPAPTLPPSEEPETLREMRAAPKDGTWN